MEPLSGLEPLRQRIAAAQDLAGLQRASADIQELAARLIENTPAEALTRLISTLNDALTRRVIEVVVAAEAAPPAARWCWIALGSEGRQEQTFASDQDNGIVFEANGPAGEVRDSLLPLALRINHALADCGFTLCKGQVMASNPKWCLSVREWRERFLGWIIEGGPQALLNATIFFDLRPISGASELAQGLAGWLGVTASDNPRFLAQMTENALRRHPPLGLLRDIVVEKDGEFAGTVDLKLFAATLFVDAARVFGLATASAGSNSADRLRHAAQAGRLDMAEVDEWLRAFYFIQALRLKFQQRSRAAGAAMHNHVDPDRLDVHERRSLLSALQQARALQKRLALAFLGSGQGI